MPAPWRRRKADDDPRKTDVDRSGGRSASDDEPVHFDDADSWWTGQGEPAQTSDVKSHLGARTPEEIREAFMRKRKRPEPKPKPHGAFEEYYSADSLFSEVSDDDADPDLFNPDDPYVVLGVPAGASWEQITAAHRRLAKLHHPDRLLGASEEEQEKSKRRMAEINIAYADLRRRRGA